MKNHLEVSIPIASPSKTIWEALTNPALIKRYFFGTEASSGWNVGDPITFKGEWEGKPYEDKGTILEVEKGRLLKYNFWSSFSGTEDKPENYANITYILSGDGGKTILTVRQDGFNSPEARDHSEKSWNTVLQNLKQLLENGD